MRKSLIINDILKEICKGKIVSGGLLASKLGVSRTAVWKAVNALRADGYFISGLGGGYVLAPENRRLCGEQLSAVTGENIVFFEETVSTNEEIKSLAELGEKEFTVAVARAQSGGKGRQGRKFYSPEGGLYFSVLLRPALSPADCLKITTAAAVSMCEAIEAVAKKDCKIKWVNDIFIKDKKVCGILTEGVLDGESGGLKYAVLGVGLNVSLPKGGFNSAIEDTADSLFQTNAAPSLVYCALLDNFIKCFKNYYKDIKDMPHLESYKKRSYLDGKKVTYVKDGKAHTATACGISEKGELIVKEKGKEILLSSGEVRVSGYE